jgi:REP element-mobilizing transposase RayT
MRGEKQQELNLYLGKRGGARPHAGRPASPNPRIPHKSRDSFHKRYPCHVTLRVRRGLQSLRLGHVLRAIEETFRRGRAREDFRLVHYSIQGNHAHLVVEADGPEALGRGMKSIASRFALAVNRALKRHGPVLYDRYHFRVMKTPTDVRNVLRYVLLNGRKHWMESLRRRGQDLSAAARARMRIVLDPASSARWFDGWREGWKLDRSPPPGFGSMPAVAVPETWLLEHGWRLLGLLDPTDAPGPRPV